MCYELFRFAWIACRARTGPGLDARPTIEPVDTPTSKERVRHAQMCGCASGIKGLAAADPAKLEALRASWPEMAARIDRIIELVDWG